MYIPHTEEDIRKMLSAIGFESISKLYEAATGLHPESEGSFDVPPAMDIIKLTKHLEKLSERNQSFSSVCFLGGGVYDHFVHPATMELLSRAEFLTCYTPYQPEASQGTLQYIFEFQTMAASLLGLDVANASMYDGASAAAEAALMAMRITKREKIAVSSALHPEYRQTIETYVRGSAKNILQIDFDGKTGATSLKSLRDSIDENVAAVIVGYPNFFGVIEDLEEIAKEIHQKGGLLITATTEGVSLGILEPPGRLGADIAVCEGLSLGLPMSFGGPGVGLFACRAGFEKQMPGRLVGRTIDADGKTAYVLTLAMREQHIRRERATSNICTNQSLCALAVAIHLSLLGPIGLKNQALLSANKSRSLFSKLISTGHFEPAFLGPVFNEKVMKVKGFEPEKLIELLSKKGFLVGPSLKKWYPELHDSIIICATERAGDEEISRLCECIKEIYK